MTTFVFSHLSVEQKAASKRANGLLACAECRRLHLQYWKLLRDLSLTEMSPDATAKYPVARVRTSACLLGTQGTQVTEVASDSNASQPTQNSPPTVDQLVNRIQQLEDALAISHSQSQSEIHPLLREELLKIKFNAKSTQVPDETDALSAKLGILNIGQQGDARYFGPSAGDEMLFQAGADFFSSEVQLPFASLQALLKELPDYSRAVTLAETYLHQGRWKGRFIGRKELFDELLLPTYSLQSQPGSSSPHKVAVLLLVFAVGAMVDLTIPYDNDEAHRYFQLGRMALSMSPVITSPEIATVQALYLMSFCHLQGNRRYNIDAAWSLASLALKRAQSLGLHREGSQWNFDNEMLNRRRTVFWDTFLMECSTSLLLGRPSSIRGSYIDCQFPEDTEEIIDENGVKQPGADRWKWQFVKEVMSVVLEETLSVSMSYSTVLVLDRKLREFRLPPHLRVSLTSFSEDDDTTPYLYMRKHLLTQSRAMSSGIYIHRHFFAEVLLRHAKDPLDSPYVASFLASYRAASVIIALYVKHFARFDAELLLRWAPTWTSLFSSAMIVGSLVVRCPSVSFAPKAYMELGLAITIFEKGAEESTRARSALNILRRLLQKATHAFHHRHEHAAKTENVPESSDIGEELQMFAGHTKVLVNKFLSSRRLSESANASTSMEALSPSSDFILEWLKSGDIGDAGRTTSSFGDEDIATPGLNREWVSFMQESGMLEI